MEAFTYFSMRAFTVYGFSEITDDYGDTSIGVTLIVLAISLAFCLKYGL